MPVVSEEELARIRAEDLAKTERYVKDERAKADAQDLTTVLAIGGALALLLLLRRKGR